MHIYAFQQRVETVLLKIYFYGWFKSTIYLALPKAHLDTTFEVGYYIWSREDYYLYHKNIHKDINIGVPSAHSAYKNHTFIKCQIVPITFFHSKIKIHFSQNWWLVPTCVHPYAHMFPVVHLSFHMLLKRLPIDAVTNFYFLPVIFPWFPQAPVAELSR